MNDEVWKRKEKGSCHDTNGFWEKLFLMVENVMTSTTENSTLSSIHEACFSGNVMWFLKSLLHEILSPWTYKRLVFPCNRIVSAAQKINGRKTHLNQM